MPSAGLTSIQTPREPAADPRAPRSRSLRTVANGRPVSFGTLAGPKAADHEASTEPGAHLGRGRGAFDATARWLRRALAESARAWALAAGVPPDLYH